MVATTRPSRLSIAALLTLALLAACSPPAEELVGSYSRPHRVFVFHGSEPVEIEVEDRLVLAASDAGLELFLRTHADAGQGCEIEGTALPERNGFALRPQADERCHLRVRREAGTVVIEEVGDTCRARACSGTAAIGRLVFSTTPRETG